MPDQNGSYFSRSWRLLTKDQGWIKPVLLLSVASFVPIFGALGVHGYSLEWARLTAWGVDAAPKQKNIKVGECIKSGWRGFLASIGYAVVAGLINSAISMIFGSNIITGALRLSVTAVATVVCLVTALRATIYQSSLAGYQVERVWEMMERDGEGLAKVGLITLLMTVIVSMATGMLFVFALIPALFRMGLSLERMGIDLTYLEYLDEPTVRMIFFEFLDTMVSMAPVLTVIAFISSIGSTFVSLMSNTAIALWFRQFNVPAWGASEDPLPMAMGLPASGYASQAYTQQPYAQQGYPQQQGYQQGYQQLGTPAESNAAAQQYAQQQPHAQQYGQPYGQPYGQQNPQQYAQPYGEQYAQQYDQAYQQPMPIPQAGEVQQQPADAQFQAPVPMAVPGYAEVPQSAYEVPQSVLPVVAEPTAEPAAEPAEEQLEDMDSVPTTVMEALSDLEEKLASELSHENTDEITDQTDIATDVESGIAAKAAEPVAEDQFSDDADSPVVEENAITAAEEEVLITPISMDEPSEVAEDASLPIESAEPVAEVIEAVTTEPTEPPVVIEPIYLDDEPFAEEQVDTAEQAPEADQASETPEE